MTKIYILTPWGTGEQVHGGFRKMTPDASGTWGDLELCEEFDDADYYVALWCGEPLRRKECPPNSVINVMLEPSGRIPDRHQLGDETLFSQWVTHTHNPIDWWVEKNYSELTNAPFPEKTELVSYITTARYVSRARVVLHPILRRFDSTFPGFLSSVAKGLEGGWKLGREGHYYRMKFLERFTRTHPEVVHVYGRNVGRFDLSQFREYKGPLDDKWSGLAPYRYSFAFECTSEKNYFSEKITDCILAGCMPLYWGCPNLHDFLPRNSFVELDITSADAVERAVEVLRSDFREENLGALQEAKHLLLNKYQFWPTIEDITYRLQARRRTIA